MNQQNKQAAKVALVTGSARRVGAVIVKTLHAAGYRVVIHCHHSLQEAESLASELNNIRENSAMVFQKDLLESDAAASMVGAVQQWTNRLDLLVNNASIFARTDTLVKGWGPQFTVNVQLPFALSLAAHSLLAKEQGVIVNITDIHAEKPLKGYAIYCQTKAALEMQTKALAKELAPEVRVNAVAPGPCMWPEHANRLSEKEQEQIIAKTLLKRCGNPESVAQMVLALAQNTYVTGQIVQVDGGRSLV